MDYKIVYVEDEPEMIDLVRLILNRKGIEVIGATGGREGLKTIREVKPDLILLDLMMPEVDGWEVCRQLKYEEETKDLPIIIITAKAQEIDRVLGLDIAKVDDYISKPFTPSELLECIQKIQSNRFDSNLA